MPTVRHEANEPTIKAVCRLKVSRLERDKLFPFFELVDMAKNYPGLVEKVIRKEAALRARLASNEINIRKQEFLDRAYELVFPGRNADDEINDRKLYAIDRAMGLVIPDEYAWADDESATENDIASSDED